MSGFSAAWLALREPADRAARDPALVERVARFLAGRPDPMIVDLGAGTGATLRAIAPRLGPRQRWLLVEGDGALAAAGREAVAAWAEGLGRAVEADGDGLAIVGHGQRIAVDWLVADLAADPLPTAEPVDLVTATALFDLVSLVFVERLAAAVAADRAGLYAALDVDGDDAWTPPHPADAAVLATFRADQTRDKGFGPALGTGATRALEEAMWARGHAVTTAPSPWRLGPADAGREHVPLGSKRSERQDYAQAFESRVISDRPDDSIRSEGALVAALAAGQADVAAAHGVDAAAWLAARLGPDVGCVVGHRDLWAEPR